MFDLNTPKIKIPKIKTPSLRRALPRKRDLARAVSFNRIREPIPAKIKKQVLGRCKNTCERKGCRIKNSEIKLQFHHKNMNNDDTRLTNIIALCLNHHWMIHKDYKKVSKKCIATGRELSSKVVKKKTADKIKKQRKQNPFGLDLGLGGLN